MRVSEEEKQNAITECLRLLGRANKLLDSAYKHHLIKSGVAANDKAGNDKGT